MSLITIMLSQTSAQTQPIQNSSLESTPNAGTYWCGGWAGSPNPTDVPSPKQLPTIDHIERIFVEPQLTNPPFAPFTATEPTVQIPKIWGNSESFPSY